MQHSINLRGFTIKRVVIVVVLLVAFVVLIKSLYTLYLRYRESTIEMERARATVVALEAREQGLRDNISDLETARGKEQEIRTRFNVAREGEGLVVIVDDMATDTATTTPPKTWWQSASAWFGSIF